MGRLLVPEGALRESPVFEVKFCRENCCGGSSFRAQIQPESGERAAGMVGPVSRDQILRRQREQGKKHIFFICSADVKKAGLVIIAKCFNIEVTSKSSVVARVV